MEIRDRVIELRRAPASELRANPKNWRRHPKQQVAALRAVLDEVGFAGALLAYVDPTFRAECSAEVPIAEVPDRALVLVDGHLRQSVVKGGLVPVLVTDLTEAEADMVLASYDPISAMAKKDKKALAELANTIEAQTAEARALIEQIAGTDGRGEVEGELTISPELFERQDYLVFLFDNEFDWQVATEALGIKQVRSAPVGGSSLTAQRKGIARALSAATLLDLLRRSGDVGAAGSAESAE